MTRVPTYNRGSGIDILNLVAKSKKIKLLSALLKYTDL